MSAPGAEPMSDAPATFEEYLASLNETGLWRREDDYRKAWNAGRASMRPIEALAQTAMRGFCEAHDADIDICPCCEAVHQADEAEKYKALAQQLLNALGEERQAGRYFPGSHAAMAAIAAAKALGLEPTK